MPNVAHEVLNDFGRAVKRARSLRGWSLDELSTAMGGTSSRSYLSNVEGGKRQISPPTVGKLIKALELEQSWIDAFLGDDTAPDAEETPTDVEAERLMRLAARDDTAPETGEDLLILLANTHAGGQYADSFTAYQALRGALEAAERIRMRGEMPDNSGGQVQAVLAEVAKRNALGDLDGADALLDAEERRMAEAHRAEKERQDAAAKAMLERRLDQDRLRNDPEAAAARLIRDLHRQAPPGVVLRATSKLLNEWREKGERGGDPFDLRVALALAKKNFEKAKGPNRAATLNDLGICYRIIGDRSSNTKFLRTAAQAFQGALKLIDKRKHPQNWAAAQHSLGNALGSLGIRSSDEMLMRDAIKALDAALSVCSKKADTKNWAQIQNSLGSALGVLGDYIKDAAAIHEAISAHEAALSVQTKETMPNEWAGNRHNMGRRHRAIARLTADSSHFDLAEAAYRDALEIRTREAAPYQWADTIGGLGELELNRFDLDGDARHLTAAEDHIRTAQGVMDTADEYLAERCEALLTRIAAAREGA